MGLYDQFPYTNFHELNLDWILNNMKAVMEKVGRISGDIDNSVKEYIDKLIDSGEFTDLIKGFFVDTTDNAVVHGADNTGVKDCTAIINNLLSTRGSCYLPNGIYMVSDSVVIPSYARLYGESTGGVIIRAMRNGPSAVIKSSLYDELKNTNTIRGDTSFSISNLTIDGNGKGVDGLGIYGYKYLVEHVDITKCRDGFVSQWGSSPGFAENGNVMHAVIRDITIAHCSAHIGQFMGPHDSYIDNLVGHNSKYGLYLVNSASGSNTISGTNLTNSHMFGIETVGIYVSGYCILQNVESESNFEGGIFVEHECKMYDCVFFNNNGDGLTIGTGCNQVICSNVTCYQNKGKDIVLGKNIKNCTINGRIFSNDGNKISVPETLINKDADPLNNRIHISMNDPYGGIDYAPMALTDITQRMGDTQYVNVTGRQIFVRFSGGAGARVVYTGASVPVNEGEWCFLPQGARITYTSKPAYMSAFFVPMTM